MISHLPEVYRVHPIRFNLRFDPVSYWQFQAPRIIADDSHMDYSKAWLQAGGGVLETTPSEHLIIDEHHVIVLPSNYTLGIDLIS
jgi:hypothetical protein